MQEAQEEWYENVYLAEIFGSRKIRQPHDANTFPTESRRESRPIPIVMSNGTVRSSVLRFFRPDSNGNVEITTTLGRVIGVLTVTHLRLILQTDAKARVGKDPVPPIGYNTVADTFNQETGVDSMFSTYSRGEWFVPAKNAPSYHEFAIPPDNRVREVELRQRIIELESEIVTLKTQARKHAEDAQRQQDAKNLRLARKQAGLPARSFNEDRGFGRGRGRGRGGGSHSSHTFHGCDTRRRSPSPAYSASRSHRARPYSPPPSRVYHHRPRRSRSRSPAPSRARSLSQASHLMDIDDDEGQEDLEMEGDDRALFDELPGTDAFATGDTLAEEGVDAGPIEAADDATLEPSPAVASSV
ncbi:hypothetical protein D9615_009050 [Tricholomella constricta]|uniref:Uncharacterized protein n=1 Tax=Tricholomella constricta TaxID=117010 RepID=A0A8H5H0Q9_9AGAR|nr:hypothetical protein D9615_009050 [Tricholomella constricta]